MPLTDTDRQFLIELKNRGYSKEQAIDELVKTKKTLLKQNSPTVSIVSSTIDNTLQNVAREQAGEQPIYNNAPNEVSAIQQVGDFVANAGARGVSKVGQGAANVAKIINPVEHLANAMGVEETPSKLIEKASQAPLEVQQKLETDQSMGGKIGGVAGDVLGTAAAQVPLLAGGAEILSGVKALPAFQKLASTTPEKAKVITDFLTKSLGTTAAITATDEGRLPTPVEAGGYGVLDAALLGFGKMGTTLYRAAFKGTKGQEKNLIKAFDKTVADTAEELGYVGSEIQIQGKARETANTIYGKISELAASNKPVTREEFIETVLPKLTKQFDQLPESGIKGQLKQTVKEVVENYAPTTTATGSELTSILEQINKGLFGEGQRAALTPKQLASVESQLKSGVKELLPEEIKPLYTDYAKNRLIEQVMADSRIKRLLGRSLIGGGTGTITGALTGDDALEKVKNGIIGGLVGSTAAFLTGNTKIGTTLGKQVEKAARPEVSVVTKNIIDKILEEFAPSDQ